MTSETLKNGANISLRHEHEKGNRVGSRYPSCNIRFPAYMGRYCCETNT